MEIRHEINQQFLILRLQGRLDAFGSKELDAALEAKNRDDLLCAVIDMAGVDYLSSAGLRVFLKAQKVFNQRGGAVILTSVQPYCASVLKFPGLPKRCRFFRPWRKAWHAPAAAQRQLIQANVAVGGIR